MRHQKDKSASLKGLTVVHKSIGTFTNSEWNRLLAGNTAWEQRVKN
jgi:hypothetical protein